MTLNVSEIIRLLSPELILLITGFVVIGVDLARRREDEGRMAAAVAVVGLILAALAAMSLYLTSPNEIVLLTLAVDLYGLFFKVAAFIGVALVIIASVNYMAGRSKYLGEFYALLVFAALAISVLVSATNLILIYVGVEFLSITSYILAGFLRGDVRSEEAAIKYFLYGASAGAILLFGMSLLFGLTGSTDLAAVGKALGAEGDMHWLGLVALMLVLAGLGYKASLVPFHQWAPDTYDGAPTPISAFLSTASKAAGFAIVGRVFLVAFPQFYPEWTQILAAMAVLTMFLGNLTALKQKSVKRMLAYSSIGQAGYILLGLVAVSSDPTFGGVNGLMIYLFGYIFTNVGAFLLLLPIEKKSGGSTDMAQFDGLATRAPGLALLMSLFLISLAGIPPTAGFIGKFYVFAAVINQQMILLGALAALNTVIAAFYYLNVIRHMYFAESSVEGGVSVGRGLMTVLAINAAMVLAIGIFAQFFMTWVNNSLALVTASGF
ncbi:MAG TPA: NADH-quinone oxidoreductase subunit N [Caldilineales bacterium]|nr:NADH-quinone oxidoreductase subunit N [Caldilineales bacterium]